MPLRPLTLLGLLTLLAPTAWAQLPTATGRQLSMSRSAWKLFIPDGYAADAGGDANLLVHFHGDPQTVWNNAAYADLNAVVVTVNYSGLSSAYSGPFSDTGLFQDLLDDARGTLAAQPDFDGGLDWDTLAVSSFSAGYGAVRQLLGVPSYRDAIDSLLAADSLYATTASDGTALDSQMAGYKAFADLAADGEKRFVFTHSQVLTYTYENTAETGDELMAHLGLTAAPIQQEGLGTLDFYRHAELGGFSLWGALGATADDHLSHLRYMGEWLDDLGFDPPGPRADFNGDGVVDAADYTIWRDNWPTFTDLGDADGDGFTGNSDYDIWAAEYGMVSPSRAASVPEPAAGFLLLLGVAAMRRRRAPRACPVGEVKHEGHGVK